MSQQQKIKVCELSGQHERNGLPEKIEVFSFFLSVYLHKKQQQRHCKTTGLHKTL